MGALGGVQIQESPHGAGFSGVFPIMWEHVETCIWWSRGDLNPKLQYPGQIKASAHYAGNLDLLDCSQ